MRMYPNTFLAGLPFPSRDYRKDLSREKAGVVHKTFLVMQRSDWRKVDPPLQIIISPVMGRGMVVR